MRHKPLREDREGGRAGAVGKKERKWDEQRLREAGYGGADNRRQRSPGARETMTAQSKRRVGWGCQGRGSPDPKPKLGLVPADRLLAAAPLQTAHASHFGLKGFLLF